MMPMRAGSSLALNGLPDVAFNRSSSLTRKGQPVELLVTTVEA